MLGRTAAEFAAGRPLGTVELDPVPAGGGVRGDRNGDVRWFGDGAPSIVVILSGAPCPGTPTPRSRPGW